MAPTERSLADRFWQKVDKRGPVPPHRPALGRCWLWLGATTPGGYGKIRNADGQVDIAHRVSFRLAGGDPTGWQVTHRCDTPACVRPSHLRLGTQAQNIAEMVARGRQARGEQHPHAKLTDRDIRAIRARCARGERQVVVAAVYGLNRSTVCMIVHRHRWAHVS